MMTSITIIVSVILILVFTTINIRYITQKYLIPKNELKDKELKNQKYTLLSTLSVDAMEEYIDLYFTKHVQNYITYKFIAKGSRYIKNDECEILITDVTKLIYLEISELYIFYIRMIYSINEDDDLLKYINMKVKETALRSVTDFNSAMQ